MLDELAVPEHIAAELVAKYMEYVCEPREFVIERHEIGDSQHFDLRLWVGKPYGEFAIGWSIVGFSKDDPAEIEKWLENIGKGFRAETKCVNPYCNEWKFRIYEKNGKYYYVLKEDIEELARQPYDWFFPKLKIGESLEIEPGEVGAGQEAPGKFTILTRGVWYSGTQKPYFHEYFLKDDRYFKDWTRIVVRAIKLQKIDPVTKKPTGKYERMWRFMIPKTQVPYAISKRAMEENWKPPKECLYPFPRDWVKKKFPDEYKRWLQWVTKSDEDDISKLEKIYEKKRAELLSKKAKFSLALVSWLGPRAKTGRRMPQFRWYLFIDDKGKGAVRTFLLDGYPFKDEIMTAFEMDRSARKWMGYNGLIGPEVKFNENKRMKAKFDTIDSGSASLDIERTKNNEEVITITFRGKKLRGKWRLIQEEPNTDSYTFEKLSQEERIASFVLDKHWFPEDDPEYHYDLRWRIGDNPYLEEFNLYDNILAAGVEEPVKAVRKKCNIDVDEWMKVKEPGTRLKAYGVWSKVETIDSGELAIIEDSPNFMSMKIRGRKLRGYFIARKEDGTWILMRSKLPGEDKLAKVEKYFELSAEGDPRTGKPYDPPIIEEKRGWSYFIVHLYDLRKFTRVEPDEMTKEYFPKLEIPEGVSLGIGLYPVPGRRHHARVAYIVFDKDKFTYDQALSWIKKHRLDTWGHVQIVRHKK